MAQLVKTLYVKLADAETWRAIEEVSAATGQSVSTITAMALRRWLSDRPPAEAAGPMEPIIVTIEDENQHQHQEGFTGRWLATHTAQDGSFSGIAMSRRGRTVYYYGVTTGWGRLADFPDFDTLEKDMHDQGADDKQFALLAEARATLLGETVRWRDDL